jgi:hypothetical protein
MENPVKEVRGTKKRGSDVDITPRQISNCAFQRQLVSKGEIQSNLQIFQ